MASPLKVTCGNCNYAGYCSESCKESDWADHRDECFYIGRSKKNPSCDTARFALRKVATQWTKSSQKSPKKNS